MRTRHYLRRWLAIISWLGMLPTAGAGTPADEIWLSASLDGVDTGLSVMLVRRADGSQWLRLLDLATLGLGAERSDQAWHEGEAIVPIAATGLRISLDPGGDRLHLHTAEAAMIAAPADDGELLLDISINRRPLAEPRLVRSVEGELWVEADMLAAEGVRPELLGDDEAGWLPLRRLAGEAIVLDVEGMRLDFSLPADSFSTRRIDLAARAVATPEGAVGATESTAAILGYDANVGTGDAGSWHSLLLDATVSRGQRGCRSRHLLRSQSPGLDRLDSGCWIDWPERALSLDVGDGVARSGVIGAGVRYGGLRLGTDFGLQPEIHRQPLYAVDGEARLPSVLELWLDQQLALRTELPPGPFAVDNIPLRAGSGVIEAVIVDALGRRTLLSTQAYSDPALLRPGLTDWSIELGWRRSGFLQAGDEYADPFALAGWRRGITRWLTIGGRLEADERGGSAEASAAVVLGGAGVAEIAVAEGRRDGVGGGARSLGYVLRGDRLSLGGRWQQRDAGYTDLAWTRPGRAPREEVQINASARLGSTSVSLGGASREAHDGRRQRLLTASLNRPLGDGQLSISAIKPVDPPGPMQYTLNLTLPLSPQHSVSTFYRDGDDAPGLVYRRQEPIGNGWGMRAAYRPGGDQPGRAELDAALRTDVARIDASLGHVDGRSDARAGVSGALLLNGDGLFAARDDGGSFATAELPGAGVGVRHDHQVAARSSASGRVVISRLRPFERNTLALVVEDLPLDADPGLGLAVVVPGRRTVSRVAFDARAEQYLAARLHLPDGSSVPVGATARMAGDADSQPVGHDGQVFLRIDGSAGEIEVRWNGSRCAVAADDLPSRPDPSDNPLLECRP